jgi:pimeloyl-ACP methyl ester carboxylesterase
MFPGRVRAAVLDGAVAPLAWAGGPGEDPNLSTFIRIGSDFGSSETIKAFLRECGAVPATACAFSAGGPEATAAKWRTLLSRARRGIAFEGDTLNDGDVLAYVASSIYLVDPLPGFSRFPGWAAVAQFLQQLWTASEAAASPSPAAETTPAPAAPADYVTSVGRQLSVVCGESPNPDTEAAASAQATLSYRRAGLSPWPFVAYCVGWSRRAANPYLGPWNRPTAAPVLVVGNTFDPATPFPSSVRMAQTLGKARLLTVNGYGHTALLNPSACARNYIAAYLINGTLPPEGAACDQETGPFAGD